MKGTIRAEVSAAFRGMALFTRTNSGATTVLEMSATPVQRDLDRSFRRTPDEAQGEEKTREGRCAKCRWLDICGGNFRVRAEAISGDVWAPDPACYLTDEEIGLE